MAFKQKFNISRAYLFDNSGNEMTFLGNYAEDEGNSLNFAATDLPDWLMSALE